MLLLRSIHRLVVVVVVVVGYCRLSDAVSVVLAEPISDTTAGGAGMSTTGRRSRRHLRRPNAVLHSIYEEYLVAGAGNDGSRRRRLATSTTSENDNNNNAMHWLSLARTKTIESSGGDGSGSRTAILVEVMTTKSDDTKADGFFNLELALLQYQQQQQQHASDIEIVACNDHRCSVWLALDSLLEVEAALLQGSSGTAAAAIRMWPELSATSGRHGRNLQNEENQEQHDDDDDDHYSCDDKQYYPDPATTPVHSQAVQALQVDKLRAKYPHLTGSGMKIGVISDSFGARWNATQSIASGNLPSSGVTVLKDYIIDGGINGKSGDEGRAMLELIYDIAPDAELYFRTGYQGEVDMAMAIQELADSGCHVIVDDVGTCVLCVCAVVLMTMKGCLIISCFPCL